MSAESLATALRAAGVACRVEAVARLAVVVPDGPEEGIAWSRRRHEVVALAREHGFTHVALELRDEGSRAGVHRGQP